MAKRPLPNNIDFKIRPATENDTQLLLTLIRELASFEKLEHEVTADTDTLRKNLFGPQKTAEAIIGEHRGEPVAFALFFHNFSTFLGKKGLYLEDLYVRPEYRGSGYGKLLLKYLAKLAQERDCGRFEWWVLDWNKKAIAFYESIGAKPMDEWTVYRMDKEAIDRLTSG